MADLLNPLLYHLKVKSHNDSAAHLHLFFFFLFAKEQFEDVLSIRILSAAVMTRPFCLCQSRVFVQIFLYPQVDFCLIENH